MPPIRKKDKVNRKLALISNSGSNSDRRCVIKDVLEVDKSWVSTLSETEIKARVAKVTPPVIHNVVASFNCNENIDVVRLARVGKGDFNAKKFSARCTLRFNLFTCGVFTKGNGLILGAKGKLHALAYAHAVCDFISEKLGIKAHMTDFVPINIQCAIDLNHPIDQEALRKAIPIATYNPDKIGHVSIPFSDRFYDNRESGRNIKEKLGHFLVYESGRIVLVGLSTMEMVQQVYNDTVEFFVNFIKID